VSDDNKRLARRLLEIIETGELESADEIISPEFRDHPADGDSPSASAAGPEAFKQIAMRLRTAFAQLHYEEQDAIAEGDKVVLRTVMRGRHEGKFGPFPPTGRSFAQQQTHTWRIADGKVADHWATRDDLGLLRQLGFLPPRPVAIARMLIYRLKGAHGQASHA